MKITPARTAETTLAALHELFQAANLRYAPVRSEQELAAIVPKLKPLRAL